MNCDPEPAKRPTPLTFLKADREAVAESIRAAIGLPDARFQIRTTMVVRITLPPQFG